MNTLKHKNMMAAYNGFRGHQTVKHVQSLINPELFDRLTGKELGLVMSSINAAYHAGRHSLCGIDLCDDAVWLPWAGENGQLIPISALRRIKITGDHYQLDYVEP